MHSFFVPASLEGEKLDPDIGVTGEILPWNTLYAKLQASFVAGNPPDLILMHASEVPQYANFGVLRRWATGTLQAAAAGR